MEGAESVRWPYQESDLINILERDEFAPILIRLAAQKFPHLIQDNCLIAEVRDFREGVLKHKFHLLKPDMVKLVTITRRIYFSNIGNSVKSIYQKVFSNFCCVCL